MRYCNNKDDAMEVVNDSFLKIFREIEHFKPQYKNYEGSLKAWMKTILINTAIDNFRKNKKAFLVAEINESHVQTFDNQESAIDKMSYAEIISMVQCLSPGYRTVFNLFVIDGFKHEEIAIQLNISVGTSKSNLAKARLNIQKMLKEASVKCYEQKAI